MIEKLVIVPGIGRWTAEMFLLFGLKRLDVLAVGDAGLQRAARNLYGKKRKSETLLPRVAESLAAVPVDRVVVFVAVFRA